MTSADVRDSIKDVISMLHAQRLYDLKGEYIGGVILGMVRAFELSGVLSIEQGAQVYFDLTKEVGS